MSRRLTMLFSAFEALLVVGIGVAIPLVPLTVLWAVQYGFGPDWVLFWRVAADAWLVGHGVDVTVRLDPATAAALAQQAGVPLKLTLAPLGFALLTALLGARAGRRIAETGHRMLGTATAVVVFAALASAVAISTVTPDARVSLWQSGYLPAGAFLIGIVASVVVAEIDDQVDAAPAGRWSLRRVIRSWPDAAVAVVGGALRTGLGAVAIVMAVSAIAVAVLIVGHYVELIRLYETLGGQWIGGLALTVGQLALLPDVVVWAASWFVGPGFALGTGSSVSPLGTAVGPLPGIPLLGAIPTGPMSFGFAGLVVPMVAGFLAAAGARTGIRRRLGSRPPARWLALVAVGGGLVAGVTMGLLAWAASGAAGPGRFERVGPDPLAVGGWAALEVAVAIGIGLVATARVGRPVVPVRREADAGAGEDEGDDADLADAHPSGRSLGAVPAADGPAARTPAPDRPASPDPDDVSTAPVPIVAPDADPVADPVVGGRPGR